ncbi:hypothetical protein ABMA27_007056 [Loxostege sticticalis]|uniref:Uncharacterized protein n=1 Tax=Loxostege sticticalis TaxID=481309 RepID=A0ABR3ILH0_LOXSC
MRLRCLSVCLSVHPSVHRSVRPSVTRLYFLDQPDNQPFIEEVVVESVLHVRSAEPGARQGRTNLQTSLKDGSRVSQPKTN